MPLIVAIGAVAVAAAAALVRPHPAPALRASNAAYGQKATADDRIAPLSSLGRSLPPDGHDPAQRDGAPQTGPTRVVVYVTGEVKRPGIYTLDARSRVDAALRAAAGPTDKADLVAVNLAEPVSDGEKVLVPAKGDPNATEASTVARGPSASSSFRDSNLPESSYGSSRRHHRRSSSTGGGRHRRSHRSHKTPPSEPIDINAADAAALEQLPGIGPSLADRIVTFREVNGPFHSTDELLDVAGMTDKRLDAISNYVMVR